jgi:hypothetical protein
MGAKNGDGGAGRLITPAASPIQAAAIIAALERFRRATAQPSRAAAPAADGWRLAAAFEAVAGAPQDYSGDPWINT